MMGYFLIIGLFTVIGMVVSGRLKSKFAKYSRVPLQSGKSGAEIAYEMLQHYGINDVKIIEGKGSLTDHYNPMKKVIALSPNVFHGRHVAAAAVAAHECGHAVQHATAYNMLTMRSRLVPVVNMSSRLQQFLFMGAMFGLGAGFAGNTILLILTVTLGITALFSFITLPVEFDASRRALNWLDASGNSSLDTEYDGAKDALWWAAMTYVTAALSALAMFLYFLLKFVGND